MENRDQLPKWVQERLLALADQRYQAFQQKLLPTVAPERILGVRSPALRKLARELSKAPEGEEYLKCLPHLYYEENNLHGYLIGELKDASACLGALNAFLPYVDNWATCDLLRPKALLMETQAFMTQIRHWLASPHLYTVRFGVVALLNWYLDERFQPGQLELVAALRSDAYYIQMAAAWYFATALTKQYEATLPYFEQRRLEPWVHNKAIQKARESLAVPRERKEALLALKIKS